MIVSRSRSPSRPSRSRSPRKGDFLDQRDWEMVSLFANGSKAKGTLPPRKTSSDDCRTWVALEVHIVGQTILVMPAPLLISSCDIGISLVSGFVGVDLEV